MSLAAQVVASRGCGEALDSSGSELVFTNPSGRKIAVRTAVHTHRDFTHQGLCVQFKLKLLLPVH